MRRLGRPLGSVDLGTGPTSYALTAAVGTFALTGQNAALRAARKMTAACGIFALTGQSASFQASVSMTASVGSFAMTGQAATLRVSRLAAAQGSFTCSGQAVTFHVARRLVAAHGSFALTGRSVNFASAVLYATIIDGVVTSIDSGTLPDSDADTLYVAIAEGEAEVGWYFSEICQTFSESAPVIAPGDIAPPYPPGSTPPVPGDEDYPEGPEDAGPAPLAETRAGILSFHADKETPLTIAACPSASTEIDPKLRTWFDLRDVCAICMQARVETELEGARVTLKYKDADDNWVALSRGRSGPFVVCEGDDEFGDLLNVHPEALGRVLLSPFVSGGDDTSDLVLGNVQAFFYFRTDNAACAEIDEDGCSIPDDVVASQGWDDFADYAAWEAFFLAQPFTSPTLWASGLASSLDETKTLNGHKSLKLSPADGDIFYSDIFGHGVDFTDLTLMLRFYLETITHTDTGTRDGFLVASSFCSGQFLDLLVRNTDRLYFTWKATDGPSTYDTEEIGPASVLFDADKELLFRTWIIDSSTIGCRIYVQSPCAEPVLLYEKLDIPNLEAATVVRDFEWMYLASDGTGGSGYTVGDLWFYPSAFASDPTVFGIPA